MSQSAAPDNAHLLDAPPRLQIASLQAMLTYMTDNGGSDLFLTGGRPVMMRLHGRMFPLMRRSLNNAEVLGLLSQNDLYGANAPSRLGGKDPINTAMDFMADGQRYRYRVNAVGCQRAGQPSVMLTIRTIPMTPPTVEALGVESEIVSLCEQSTQGLILVTGGTGNGKSTTLAALIRHLIEGPGKNRNVVTIEEPVEFVHDEVDQPDSLVTQIQVHQGIGSFHEGVINAMRMAPTTILIGESRDYETVSAAVEASVTGHVAFSTVHTNSVAETLQRLVSLYPENLQNQARVDIVQALRMIVTQRLVPSTDGKRVAIREYMIFSQEVKNKLYNSGNITETALRLVREYGRPMVVDAQEKFDQGWISADTLERQKINYAAFERAATQNA